MNTTELALRYAAQVNDARRRVEEIADGYVQRATTAGYLPLVGVATAGGLMAAVGMALDGNGFVDPSKLDPDVVEGFQLQFPRLYADGALSRLTMSEAESYANGWTGKITEIRVRDALNDGESIGGLRLADGETAVLTDDPTQALWDMRIEPSGRLLQIKSTDSVAYVRETMNDLEGTGIDIITTDLPEFSADFDGELYEMSVSKAEIDEFLRADLDAADDDWDISSVLGPLGFLVMGGSALLLVKKVRDEIKRGADMRTLYRSFGPSVVSRAVNLASPIPFTGNAAGWYLRRRILLEEAVRVARERLARAERLVRLRGQHTSQSSNFTS
ncbi:MAG: hypothetical protein RLY50_550 [Actinomycetota bacterium]